MTAFLYIFDKIIVSAILNIVVFASQNSQALHYLYNGHADVTALVSSSIVIASYYYDAFGVPIEETGSADNPNRYAGYEYDIEVELYNLKARFYNAGLARFLQEDTYRGTVNDPLSLNLYTYCKNNPLMYIDPTGHYTDYSQIDYAKEAARMNIAQTGAWKDVVDQRLADIGTKYMGGITDLHVVTQILQTVEQPKTASNINSTATNTVAPSATSPTVPNNTKKTVTSSKTTIIAPPVVSPVSDTRTAMQIASSVTSDHFNEYGTAGYNQEKGNLTYIGNYWNQFDVNNLIQPGNLIDLVAGVYEIGGEAGKEYVPNIIRNAVKPSNIGVGAWKAYIESEVKIAVSKFGQISKIAKVAGYSAVGVDVGYGIYDNIQQGTDTRRIVSDAAVDTAFGFGGIGTSVLAGAAAGSVIPGPGTVVGAVGGLVGGAIYVVGTEVWQPGGISIKERAKEMFYDHIK